MKQLFFAIISLVCIHANGQKVTSSLVDSKIAAANKSIISANGLQDQKIGTLTSQVQSLAADTLLLRKNITDLTGKLNAVTGRLSNAEARNLTDSSKILAMNITIADLQRQINDVSDVAVKAYMQAGKADSLTNVPGETTLIKKADGSWTIGVYNYAQLLQRVQNLEAKKP